MIAGSSHGLKLRLHPAAGRNHVTERRTDLTSVRRMDDFHAGKHPLHCAEGGPVWRVRILIRGEPRPHWRAYRAVDYPTPEAVARRCAEGLSAKAGRGRVRC